MMLLEASFRDLIETDGNLEVPMGKKIASRYWNLRITAKNGDKGIKEATKISSRDEKLVV